MEAPSYTEHLEARLAEALQSVHTLEEHLVAIRSHMEICTPTGFKMSATWVLANRALGEGKL